MTGRGVRGSACRCVKLLLDMNLSPDWVLLLQEHGFEAVHWSSVGAANADDTDIMRWARDNQAVVFTHDLDFGIALALTRGPLQASFRFARRTCLRRIWAQRLFRCFTRTAESLACGALVTVDEAKSRVRILPIESKTRNG